MEKIITERQPVKLYVAKAYASCYVEWKGADKSEMYKFIRENFKVSVDGLVTMQ
jgi:hypothetical protein